MNVLVTGGAGYIGSHFVKFLLNKNENVTVIDNLGRGHAEAVPAKVDFQKMDLLNYSQLLEYLSTKNFDAVVHFAAFAYVGESVENPALYYTNNVVGSLNLIKAAVKSGIRKIIFSSTCSVYGNPLEVPISEDEPTKPINPYAESKLVIEKILRDFETAYGLHYIALRYFNAAGADPEGEIGESHDPEPHLIPLVLQTALGKRDKIYIFGDDYNTPDGTCIRDYIHVNDLAEAHYLALNYLDRNQTSEVFNLGTGSGNSVKEIIDTAAKVTGREIKSEVTDRRPGDPAVLVADNSRAKKVLGWQPKFNLEDIISSAYNWHRNPKF